MENKRRLDYCEYGCEYGCEYSRDYLESLTVIALSA